MNTLRYVAGCVLPVALAILPRRMTSQEAKAEMLTIGLQESLFEHRFQISGPARGFFQFEKNGGVRGVLEHRATRPIIEPILSDMVYPATAEACYEAIAHNDVLACVFARLLLWTHPRPLPGRDDVQGAWQQYLDTWHPGKPHESTWQAYHSRAWKVLDEVSP